MDSYKKIEELLEDALKDPYKNRDKLVIAKYLLEQLLSKTDTNYEHMRIKKIIEHVDSILDKI